MKVIKTLFQISDIESLNIFKDYLDEFCNDWKIFYINLITGEIYDEDIITWLPDAKEIIEDECQIIVDAEGDIANITFMCYLIEKRLRVIDDLENRVDIEKRISLPTNKKTESYESILNKIKELLI